MIQAVATYLLIKMQMLSFFKMFSPYLVFDTFYFGIRAETNFFFLAHCVFITERFKCEIRSQKEWSCVPEAKFCPSNWVEEVT